MRSSIIVICLVGMMVVGCTFTIEDPSVKAKQEQTEILQERIEAYKLLEEEARLVHSLTKFKAETALIQAGRIKPPE